MIKLLRVDYRLIHGQVAYAWTNYLGADCILVANDGLKTDPIRVQALKLAKPAGIKLVLKNVEDSIQAINSSVTDKYQLFILVDNMRDSKRLAEACPAIKSVNVGNLFASGGKALSVRCFATEDDLQIMRELKEENIDIDIRSVPTDARAAVDF